MKILRLIAVTVIIVMLIMTLMLFALAQEDLKEFELGFPNRHDELSWQDIQSSMDDEDDEDSEWNGLTIDILKASKTLIIEIESEPSVDFELLIISNDDLDSESVRRTSTVRYSRNEVFEDGIITIDLENNPGWQKVTSEGKPGFRIALVGTGWRLEGDIFGILKYNPAEIEEFELAKFNTEFDRPQTEQGFSDQARADWELEDMIGLTNEIFIRATSLKIETGRAPVGDIGFAYISRATNWSWTNSQITYTVEDVYDDGIITIPLTGGNALPFIEENRDDLVPDFAIAFLYSGSDSTPQTISDLNIRRMWLDFSPLEEEPDPDPTPDPDPDTTPDPVTTPAPTPEPLPAPPPYLELDDKISPWGGIVLVSVLVVSGIVVILVFITKRK